MGHYPYGESWYNATNDKLLFTGYERDSESGNDYAMARYYVSRLARFSTPDLLLGTILDPQSLNRYVYARDNPIMMVDPSGMDPCLIDAELRKRREQFEIAARGPSNAAFDADPLAAQFPDSGCDLNGSIPGGGGGATIDPPVLNNGTLPDPCAGNTNTCVAVSASPGPDNPDYNDPSTDPALTYPTHQITPGGGGFYGGPFDAKPFIGKALVALLNPGCANLFGGFKNAVSSLLNSSYNRYVPGQQNPFAGRLSTQSWDATVQSFANPDVRAVTLAYSQKPGGAIFFSGTFNTLAPAMQMTAWFHEQEHAANHNSHLDETIDANPASYDADFKKINERCGPKDIPLEAAPAGQWTE